MPRSQTNYTPVLARVSLKLEIGALWTVLQVSLETAVGWLSFGTSLSHRSSERRRGSSSLRCSTRHTLYLDCGLCDWAAPRDFGKDTTESWKLEEKISRGDVQWTSREVSDNDHYHRTWKQRLVYGHIPSPCDNEAESHFCSPLRDKIGVAETTMPVPPMKKNRPTSLWRKSAQCQLGIRKNVTQDAMSLLYMNVWLTSTIADANVNRRRGRQLVVHIMFLFYSTVCGQAHLLPLRVPFADFCLVHGRITYCMPGRRTKWIQLKILALLINCCVNK
jgi:hypothetical protein